MCHMSHCDNKIEKALPPFSLTHSHTHTHTHTHTLMSKAHHTKNKHDTHINISSKRNTTPPHPHIWTPSLHQYAASIYMPQNHTLSHTHTHTHCPQTRC